MAWKCWSGDANFGSVVTTGSGDVRSVLTFCLQVNQGKGGPPTLHRDLAMEAGREGVSLNQLATLKLARR
ncbi:toxin-antitoxin system HicB family antitoxin [uncultured Corynebacterium sp.]|uniref:toxin-antitoxin system HicB family antitoxin n=1 Tax=uncultured Corynebacterium sp. TaxID=159447 RepID=UPI00345C34D9